MTDHKYLLGILAENKSVHVVKTSKIQWWATTILANDYTLSYKLGKKHANAEGLS